jgi:DtxR family transcriptional regulator, Mn-dependent transcriptional regulator
MSHDRPDGEPLSASVEDYMKAVYSLSEYSGGAPVTTTALAEHLQVGASSVSGMLRRLDQLGLVEHVPYRGVRLTPTGRARALGVVRRHRLLELFLVRTLDVPWDEVHEEADALEHAISPRLEARIATLLGDPEHDPHGDPIPTEDGEVARPHTESLADVPDGTTGTLARVSDHDPQMLRFLSTLPIHIGDRLQVVSRQPFGGPLTVRVGEPPSTAEHALGTDLVAAMRLLPD